VTVKPLVVAIYPAPGFKDPYSEILRPFGSFSPLCEVEAVEPSNHKRHGVMILYI
jgi:hypothetical protein